MKVLLVDDNPDDVERFRRLVRSLDWHVLSAANAAECLGAIRSAGPDVIVLDYNLGDAYGTDVLLRLRESGIQTPAIVQSGLPGALQAMGGLPAGASGFVSKNSPHYQKEIVELIQTTAAGRLGALRPEPEFSADSWPVIDDVLRLLVEQAAPRFSCAGFARIRNRVVSTQLAIGSIASTPELEGLGRLAKAAPSLAASLMEAGVQSSILEFEASRVCLAPINGLGTLFASCASSESGSILGRERFEAAATALRSLNPRAMNRAQSGRP